MAPTPLGNLPHVRRAKCPTGVCRTARSENRRTPRWTRSRTGRRQTSHRRPDLVLAEVLQEVTSPEEEPERADRSLATSHHEVIKQWAEERGGQPATVEGTEHGDHLGVLRIDFGGGSGNLRHVSWEEWFETFDVRRLNFIYQEQTSDGTQSNFFRLESPDREDG
jgi:hypothetical protein